jgi:hypothetical protein
MIAPNIVSMALQMSGNFDGIAKQVPSGMTEQIHFLA